MPDVSVIIPARNEEWLSRTVRDVLGNAKADTEVIAVCDGYWPDPPLQDHPKLTVIHYTVPVGQRMAVNQGVRISRAKYVMKLDGHSAVDEGFDVKLMAPYEDNRLSEDVTTIPRMYNLHAFDWKCQACPFQTYQGPKPTVCPKCQGIEFAKLEIWKPRQSRRTDFARFDSELHFQYWPKYERRPESQGDLSDVMSSVGACFFMTRRRFRQIEGLDEKTGFWGQFGTEISCKSWLSGGRQVVNKTTWFSHMFRTRADFSFPYKISGNDQERARRYSRDFWRKGKWKLQTRPLAWFVQKFWPIPGWTDADLEALK
jgi:glycosyltransferase involved in cell wall biosynthesis